ncbi:MAG: DUF3592 domain-containing protein [Aggregatilineales bacterium]
MNIIPLLCLIGFAAIVIVLVAAWINDRRVRDELRQQGVTAQAVITDRKHEHHTSQDKNGFVSTSDNYYVSYRYTVNGQEYRGQESVSLNTYEILMQGAPVEVVYLPSKPNEVRLASDL